ncbi:alpha-ketoglutarate-dependent dioxygenase AlkB [Veronia nyctiphanis]|uniref:Alpha-ketoglutarate-dependent dioxygenase AlkB n=1 Tax=Veronia nyctiphanis TaxID=1278244 RepID=A0A4Q0YKB7_9GAMM|nr:alpha-ketoglutarate-dependent dioxygenase AlkB [Veronia nyctiphanis]RXJ71160.1 alpha-ketoglutarate-dependent dioxygenase AlkB [Veronia nyctiphanis]
MRQQELFGPETDVDLGEDSWLIWQPDFISSYEAERIFTDLVEGLQWYQLPITLFGREMLQPRLQAWYGDKHYTYSGLTLTPQKMPQTLLDIKSRCEALSGTVFNSVLVNYYRDGQDYMGWHQDNERELGEDPVIASVSLGESRRFIFRHVKTKEKKEFALTSGSILVMGGKTQTFWQHTIPKMAKIHGGRINLTFRNIIS